MSCIPKTPEERIRVREEIKRTELVVARASDDFATRRSRFRRFLRILARPCRVTEMRSAIASMDLLNPTNTSDLDRYVAAGFNTVVVEDRADMTFRSESDIKRCVEVARSRNLSIMLSCYADTVGGTIPALTRQQVADRLKLWVKYDEGDILGVFFLGDDAFLTMTPVARQQEWYAGVKDVTTSIPVFGMIGEFALARPELTASCFDTDAFDHLLVLCFPYNLGHHWGHDIGTDVPDADLQLQVYLQQYIDELSTGYLNSLHKGQQVTLCVQGFNYISAGASEPLRKIVRASDVNIQMTYGSDLVRSLPGQSNNFSMTVFWWGTLPNLVGLRDNDVLTESAQRANYILSDDAACGPHLACQMAHEVFVGGEL